MIKFRVREEGTLDGLAEEARELYLGRAVGAVREASERVRRRVDRLLSRRSAAPAPPGQPPREVTGELRRSISKIPVRRSRYRARGGVQSDDPAAPRHEFGGTAADGSRIPARPFFRPAFHQEEPSIERLFEAEI